jgi:hypothetical protein
MRFPARSISFEISIHELVVNFCIYPHIGHLQTYTPLAARKRDCVTRTMGVGLTHLPSPERKFRCRTYPPVPRRRIVPSAQGRWGGVSASVNGDRQDEMLSLQELYNGGWGWLWLCRQPVRQSADGVTELRAKLGYLILTATIIGFPPFTTGLSSGSWNMPLVPASL